jgi:hypothetical protein
VQKVGLSRVVINSAKEKYWCVTWPEIGKDRRQRKFFRLREEAAAFCEQKRLEQLYYGAAGLSFTEAERFEYRQCAEKLRPFGKTITDAVTFYLPHLQAANRSCSAAELVEELLRVKTGDGMSERYLGDLRGRLKAFADSFNGKSIAQITGAEIDEWLRSLSVGPVTRNNFRRVLIVAFNFAHSRGYCSSNPAKGSAKAKEIGAPPGILSVSETARLLENAAPEILPYLAIGAFAGLRRAELERLDSNEVDLEMRPYRSHRKERKDRTTSTCEDTTESARMAAAAPQTYRQGDARREFPAVVRSSPQSGEYHSMAG